MADPDYYNELYTVIDAAEDGKIQLWERWPYSEYWGGDCLPEYYTEKEFLWHKLSVYYDHNTVKVVKLGLDEWRHRGSMDDEYGDKIDLMIEYKKKSKSLCNYVIALAKAVD
jgi:hypothetical protein